MLDRFAADVEEAEFDLWRQTSITSVDLKARRVSLASGEDLQIDSDRDRDWSSTRDSLVCRERESLPVKG